MHDSKRIYLLDARNYRGLARYYMLTRNAFRMRYFYRLARGALRQARLATHA